MKVGGVVGFLEDYDRCGVKDKIISMLTKMVAKIVKKNMKEGLRGSKGEAEISNFCSILPIDNLLFVSLAPIVKKEYSSKLDKMSTDDLVAISQALNSQIDSTTYSNEAFGLFNYMIESPRINALLSNLSKKETV